MMLMLFLLTSQTTMASWLVPLRPCCVKTQAASEAPLETMRPGMIARSASALLSACNRLSSASLCLPSFPSAACCHCCSFSLPLLAPPPRPPHVGSMHNTPSSLLSCATLRNSLPCLFLPLPYPSYNALFPISFVLHPPHSFYNALSPISFALQPPLASISSSQSITKSARKSRRQTLGLLGATSGWAWPPLNWS